MNAIDILLTLIFFMAFIGIRYFIKDSVKSALDEYFKQKQT